MNTTPAAVLPHKRGSAVTRPVTGGGAAFSRCAWPQPAAEHEVAPPPKQPFGWGGAAGCRVRQLVNEAELLSALAAALPAHRVEAFDSAGLPLHQQVISSLYACRVKAGASLPAPGRNGGGVGQVLLFATASAVVGAHGAGLANALFARPGAPLPPHALLSNPPLDIHSCARVVLPAATSMLRADAPPLDPTGS